MTTRRYPRSTMEAWPDRHPYCIEAPPATERIAGAIFGAAVIGGLVLTVALVLVRWAAA